MSILISLCHTTARTPDGWRDAAQSWLNNCDHPELVEHILVTDDPIEVSPIFPNTIVGVNDGPRNCVAGWNKAYALSSGKLIISLADDWTPCPHWDTELLNRIPDRNLEDVGRMGLNGEHVISVDTGGNRHLMPFVIATRAYLHRYNGGEGWMFYPEYDGMYCDNDFTDSARVAKVVIGAHDLLFQHWHPAHMASIQPDAIHMKQARPEAYKIGIKVYKRRSKEKGLKIRPRLAICLPGETFSSVWLAYWTTLVDSLSKKFDISPIFGWSSNVHVTRACFTQQIVGSIPLPDYVLWIDDDNLVTVAQFEMLLADLEAMPEADIMAGWCWVQPDVYSGGAALTSVGNFDEEGISRSIPYEELMGGEFDVKRVGYTGFPVVLMRGEALEKAGENPFLPVIDARLPYGFLSEDVSFCIHARQGGCSIFVDRRVKVPHLKLRDAEPKEIPTVNAADSKEVAALK